MINTLQFNSTFIAYNCNSYSSTVFYNNVEESLSHKCMNRVLPTIPELGNKPQLRKRAELEGDRR